jgi:hypothetical protein
MISQRAQLVLQQYHSLTLLEQAEVKSELWPVVNDEAYDEPSQADLIEIALRTDNALSGRTKIWSQNEAYSHITRALDAIRGGRS